MKAVKTSRLKKWCYVYGLIDGRRNSATLLRFSCGFWDADRYSKQQLHVSSQSKVRTLVYG